MVYIAIDHNPRGEFVSHEAGAVNYAGLSEIFLSWFVLVGLAVALVVWVLGDWLCTGRSGRMLRKGDNSYDRGDI